MTQSSYTTYNKALEISLAALKDANRLLNINPDLAKIQVTIASAAARLAEASK